MDAYMSHCYLAVPSNGQSRVSMAARVPTEVDTEAGGTVHILRLMTLTEIKVVGMVGQQSSPAWPDLMVQDRHSPPDNGHE